MRKQTTPVRRIATFVVGTLASGFLALCSCGCLLAAVSGGGTDNFDAAGNPVYAPGQHEIAIACLVLTLAILALAVLVITLVRTFRGVAVFPPLPASSD